MRLNSATTACLASSRSLGEFGLQLLLGRLAESGELGLGLLLQPLGLGGDGFVRLLSELGQGGGHVRFSLSASAAIWALFAVAEPLLDGRRLLIDAGIDSAESDAFSEPYSSARRRSQRRPKAEAESVRPAIPQGNSSEHKRVGMDFSQG